MANHEKSCNAPKDPMIPCTCGFDAKQRRDFLSYCAAQHVSIKDLIVELRPDEVWFKDRITGRFVAVAHCEPGASDAPEAWHDKLCGWIWDERRHNSKSRRQFKAPTTEEQNQ